MFKGSIPALVTPMRNGSLDEDAFRAFVGWQIAEGSHGLVPVGTTGESPTLSHEEHRRVVELCVEVAAKRVPVIAGAGSNSTKEAIELAVHAEKAGADAVLVVTPYYNKPNQRGLYAHFRAVAEAIKLPLIIYNIPPRSVIDMAPKTMGKLFRDCENIVGVKDATANLARASLQRHRMGAEFLQLSGEDITALGFMAHGGHGCISVTANVAPKLCAEFRRRASRAIIRRRSSTRTGLRRSTARCSWSQARRRPSLRCLSSATCETMCDCRLLQLARIRARRSSSPCATPAS
jgi:4-hydroxy-tetrahydrodipicolinate synthase